MFALFKKRQAKKIRRDNMKAVAKRISKNQEAVYQAVKAYGRPINGLALAKLMSYDSASVTPRLSELVKKDRLKVAYTKHGLDGKTRNFYEVKHV